MFAVRNQQPGEVDLGEHLAQYRGKQVVLVLAVVGEAEPGVVLCGICGFPMNAAGECPRCRLATEEAAEAIKRAVAEERLMEDVEDHLRGLESGAWNRMQPATAASSSC